MYYLSGSRLLPEYRTLDTEDPIRDVLDELVAGPQASTSTTSVEFDVGGVHVAEGGGRILLRLPDAFWNQPPARVRSAAAQIVYSLGALEEGRAVTLLDGDRLGDVPDGSGGVLEQPLRRGDLRSLRPWLQIVQPVAGAVVGERIPVSVVADRGVDVTAWASNGTEVSDHVVLRAGKGAVRLPAAGERGDLVVIVEDDRGHRVEVPVRTTG